CSNEYWTEFRIPGSDSVSVPSKSNKIASYLTKSAPFSKDLFGFCLIYDPNLPLFRQTKRRAARLHGAAHGGNLHSGNPVPRGHPGDARRIQPHRARANAPGRLVKGHLFDLAQSRL